MFDGVSPRSAATRIVAILLIWSLRWGSSCGVYDGRRTSLLSKIGSPLNRSSNNPWFDSSLSRSVPSRCEENPALPSISRPSRSGGCVSSSDIRRIRTPSFRLEILYREWIVDAIDGPDWPIYDLDYLARIQLMQTNQRKTLILNSSLQFLHETTVTDLTGRIEGGSTDGQRYGGWIEIRYNHTRGEGLSVTGRRVSVSNHAALGLYPFASCRTTTWACKSHRDGPSIEQRLDKGDRPREPVRRREHITLVTSFLGFE